MVTARRAVSGDTPDERDSTRGPNGASLPLMGLGSAIRTRFGKLSTKAKVGAVAITIAAIGGLEALVVLLGGDFLVGFINDQIVALVGPWIPHVGQVMATHAFALLAAGGLLWFAASWGYWLGVHDPVAVGSAPLSDEAATKKRQDDESRLIAMTAMREIRSELEIAEKKVARSLVGDEDRSRILQSHRPTILANLIRVRKAGFAIPFLEKFDAHEADVVNRYISEVLPLVERDLLDEAKSCASNLVVAITAVLEDIKKAGA